MYKKMEISDKTIELARKAEENIQKEFKQVELVCEYNSLKVLKAFQKTIYQICILMEQQVMDMEI